MNILIVHNFYKIPGGEDTVVKNEIKLLKMHGHNVYTYFKDNKDISTNGIFNKIKLFKNTIFNKSIKKEIQTIIKENKIDVVHCHNTFPLISPSIYKYAKQMGCKVFQTIHNFRFLCASAELYKDKTICEECLNKNIKCALKHKCYHNSFSQTLSWYKLQKNFRKKKLYNYVDKFICLTEFNSIKLSHIIPKEKIAIKPNFAFIDSKISKKSSEQFLYLGRIEEIKGIDTLINVFSKDGMPKLVLCGKGNDLEKYKACVKTDNILFKGFCNKEQMVEELEKSTAIIVPSKWYEPFSMVLVEGMHAGISVIARNIGSLPYNVLDNVNGLLFNTEDELSDIVKNLYNDKTLQDKLSIGAYNYAKEKLSAEVNYQKLMSIYCEGDD